MFLILLLFGCWSVSKLLLLLLLFLNFFKIIKYWNAWNNYLHLKFEKKKSFCWEANTQVIGPYEIICLKLQACMTQIKILNIRVKYLEPFDYIEHIVCCWYTGKCRYVMLKCKVEKCCLIGVHRFDFMLSDLFFVCVFRGGVVIEITNRFCYEYDKIRD